MAVQSRQCSAERLYRLAVGRTDRRCRRSFHFQAWVEPAGAHAISDLLGGLLVDLTLPHDAAEGGLDVTGRATKSIVEVEMAESGIEIVARKQGHHPPAEPKALRIGCRSAQKFFGFDIFVELFLAILAFRGRWL